MGLPPVYRYCKSALAGLLFYNNGLTIVLNSGWDAESLDGSTV
jgi:hypothetical protein